MVMALEDKVSDLAENKGHQTPLQQFMEGRKAVKRLADTLYTHHQEAYTSAANVHLKNGRGQIDFSQLEDAAVQEKFAQQMTDFYVAKAKENFGIGKDVKLDPIRVNQLLFAYAGITKDQLIRLIKQRGENFTHEHFSSVAKELSDSVHERLAPTAAEHVKPEHIPGILKDMKLDDIVDATKVRLEEVVGLMGVYHAQGGVVPPPSYKNAAYLKKQREPAPAGAHH